MEPVRLLFPVDETVKAGAWIEFYQADVNGVFDFSTPIGRKVLARPARDRDVFWLTGQWNRVPHLQGVGKRGWLDGPWLRGEWLRFQDYVAFAGGTFYNSLATDGAHKYAARMFDELGQVDPTTPTSESVIINTDPQAATDLAAVSIVAGVITLSFTKSPDLKDIA